MILRDFSNRSINSPRYVVMPSAKGIFFGLFVTPLVANRIHLFFKTPGKFLGFVKLLIKIIFIVFILNLIINY